MNPTLFMMVGIPGSGKSITATVYSIEHNAKIFSSDEYRLRLLGDESEQSNNKLVFDTLYSDIAFELSNGINCILDATNISVKSRSKSIIAIKSLLKNRYHSNINFNINAIVCLSNISDCIVRDAARNRSVGKDVILKFVSRFEFPQYFEGFYYIMLVNTECSSRADFYSRMSGFNQNSKYHKYDLLTHSLLLSDYFNEEDVRHEAAIFHDIGKVFTETKDSEGYSHYYCHANYSAYIVACNISIFKSLYSKPKDVLDIIFYINQHMHIRDIIKSEKAIKRYKELWGEDRFNKLVEFMNNDNKASGRCY